MPEKTQKAKWIVALSLRYPAGTSVYSEEECEKDRTSSNHQVSPKISRPLPPKIKSRPELSATIVGHTRSDGDALSTGVSHLTHLKREKPFSRQRNCAGRTWSSQDRKSRVLCCTCATEKRSYILDLPYVHRNRPASDPVSLYRHPAQHCHQKKSRVCGRTCKGMTTAAKGPGFCFDAMPLPLSRSLDLFQLPEIIKKGTHRRFPSIKPYGTIRLGQSHSNVKCGIQASK